MPPEDKVSLIGCLVNIINTYTGNMPPLGTPGITKIRINARVILAYTAF